MLGRVGFALGLVLALVSCATPYQQDRWYGGGYGEEKVGDAEYDVYFANSGYTGSDRVRAFWLYRCAELTVENGFHLMATDELGFRTASVRRYAPAGFSPLPFLFIFPPISGSPVLLPVRHSGRVSMYREPLPQELAFALDAKRVMEQLKPYVDSDGAGAYPDIDAIFVDALVAHETVTLSVRLPEARQPADSTSDSRDPVEIRARLGSLELVLKLHGLYRAHTQSGGHAESGIVQLALRVAPDGSVPACIVGSTNLSNSLVEALRPLVCGIQFDEESVSTTDVAFSVAFAPRAPELPL